MLGSKHLSNGLFDKYLGRLEKCKEVADNFNQTIFNLISSFQLFLIFRELVGIVQIHDNKMLGTNSA